MREFDSATIKLSDEMKKGENIQRAKSLEKPQEEQENEEISIINSIKIPAPEITSCRMSSFITEQILNDEHLTNETIIKNQCSSCGMALKMLYLDQVDNKIIIKRILSKYFVLIITGQLCVLNP